MSTSSPLTTFPASMTRRPRMATELIGKQVTAFLAEFEAAVERETRIKCATIAVHVSADWADSHDTTCHDCSRTSSELGEAIRKKIMEVPE